MCIFKRIKKVEDLLDKLYFRSISMQCDIDYLNWLNGVTLKFQNNSPNPDPVYACEGDSGFDLRAWIKPEDDGAFVGEDNVHYITLQPHERRLIHTGIKCELPQHVEIQVRPRSGNALKLGLSIVNTPGTVDLGYRNEIGVILYNTSNKEVIVRNGDRIAQAVLCPVLNSYYVNLEKIDAISTNTERGEDGYGHTGTK